MKLQFSCILLRNSAAPLTQLLSLLSLTACLFKFWKVVSLYTWINPLSMLFTVPHDSFLWHFILYRLLQQECPGSNCYCSQICALYIISHSAPSVRVLSVLPLDSSSSWDQLPDVSTTCPACHLQQLHSLYVTEIHYPLSFTEHPFSALYWGTEFCYWFPFSCRLDFILKSSYLLISAEIHVLSQFSFERTSLTIQSVQNILTCTGRAPHWAPEMSWYSTSSFITIFTLDCKFIFRVS